MKKLLISIVALVLLVVSNAQAQQMICVDSNSAPMQAKCESNGSLDVYDTYIMGSSVDYDTGSGTDRHLAVGLVVPGSGGHTIVGTLTSPLAVQISADGTHAMGASYPVVVSATAAANAVGNPLYTSISKNTTANALNNPIYTQISADGTNAVGASYPLPISATAAANSLSNPVFCQLSDGSGHAQGQSTSYPNYNRTQDGDSTVLQDVEDSQADGVATTLNGAVTNSRLFAYNGATMDMLRIDGSKNLAVYDATVRPGENASLGTRDINKLYSQGYHPAKTTTADILGTLKTVLASVEILDYPNCTIWVRNNDAAKAFTDFAIFVSPDNAGTCGDVNWVSVASTTCDTLAATNTCYQALAVGHSFRYVCAQAKCAASTDDCDSVDAWITCNPA